MSGVYPECPKCGYKPSEPLPASASCSACGIYFFKWTAGRRGAAPSSADKLTVTDEAEAAGFSPLQPLDEMDVVSFYGRCSVLAMLIIWSGFLIHYDYRTGEIGMSFMHNILLPIHEAGHVLFRPFGEFMTILGGSFFQVLLPLGIGGAFFWKNRDNFGAAIGAWWASVSLVDLSPYIYDALHPQLVLLGGHTGDDGGPHDWIYLLTSVGQLRHAQGLGAFVHLCGALFMVAALLWAAAVLWRQREH